MISFSEKMMGMGLLAVLCAVLSLSSVPSAHMHVCLLLPLINAPLWTIGLHYMQCLAQVCTVPADVPSLHMPSMHKKYMPSHALHNDTDGCTVRTHTKRSLYALRQAFRERDQQTYVESE